MMRVLIVDDQAANRLLLSDMVRGFGYQCLTVNDGADALAVYPRFTPDLVLLDVLMPGLSGLATAPKLKQLAGEVHLPIIFITALDEQETLLQCLEAGGDDFISKPFEPVVLEAKLRAHMRTRELSSSLAEKNKALAYHSSRIEREHQIVEHIFQNSLAHNYLDYPNLHTYLSPMSMFNGDLLLAAPGPLGNIYVLLGDFTGHGLSAAVGALPTSQTFFSLTEQGASVGEIVREINKRLHHLLPTDMFLAALVVELSASGERVSYWNGGIPPAVLLGADQRAWAALQPQHLALGILTDNEFDSRVSSLRVSPDDSLVLYTDGLTELPAEQGMLGVDGVRELLQGCTNMGELTAAVQRLMIGRKQRDDVSMAWLRCRPTGLKPRQDNTTPSGIPFEVKIRLHSEDIQQLDPVNQIVRDLSHIPGFGLVKSQLFTVLQEAYSNALEHGLLQLDSSLKSTPEGFEQYYQLYQERLQALQHGWIEFGIEYCPARRYLKLRVTDSGAGFSHAELVAEEPTDDGFGRGLQLIRQLTSELCWNDNGRTVECILPM
ncbi:hypothetical protein CWE12_11080 [Aliidiomarina sedimenti]|uniref:Response regulatory domain-containing protein n=2 Tax=Aliidiomarina sedimenti TaxID=1933879 RepID=A0ABY0BWX2_9GAMM|nr:hypothetical protein CWE12_11080 [Aliidiomarina sedimenti]